jgi:hypothetical protein
MRCTPRDRGPVGGTVAVLWPITVANTSTTVLRACGAAVENIAAPIGRVGGIPFGTDVRVARHEVRRDVVPNPNLHHAHRVPDGLTH